MFIGWSVWSKWLSRRPETKRQRDICVEAEGFEKAMRWSRDVCVDVALKRRCDRREVSGSWSPLLPGVTEDADKRKDCGIMSQKFLT